MSAAGDRCSSRAFLEVDHREPRARGGSGEVSNLRVLCRAHNRFAAEQAFGKKHVAQRIAEARVIHTAESNKRATIRSGLLNMSFKAANVDRVLSTCSAAGSLR